MVDKHYYYWITATDSTGKPYLIYGGMTEDEGRQKGLEMLGGVDFELKRLPTRNMQRASSMLKGGRLEKTHSLKEAGRRVGHNKSLKRIRRRNPLPEYNY
tara:strand:+ start:7029 stop:7328 length:300 start_codon:yes stop_codon:yes gene_type:complete